MEFDILNELVTSTVFELFTNTEAIVLEGKDKVKELEGLIKQENSSRRSSISVNDSLISVTSEGSAREAPANRSSVRNYRTVAEWMDQQAPKRLKQSFKKIGIDQSLLKSNKKAELEHYIQVMSTEDLSNEKKKVKNELRCYDNDFNTCFKKQPSHEQKEPFRPLYVYYKKLKQHLTKRGVQEMSQQKIQQMIRNIKNQRKQLRQKIENYQKQFQRTNNRRIRYVRDISPIDYEYKKYKQLKTELQKYEDMLNR